MDFVALLTTIILVVAGLLTFMGVPVAIFLMKDKLSFWPRQKWRILIYEAEVKDFPTTKEEQLIGTDGKPIFDTQGRPVTNTIQSGTEKRLIISETPELDTYCWKINKKIIPWLWVDQGFMKGFVLDLTFLAYNAEISPGEKAIRVAHLSKGVWEGGNFYPIGQPDVIELDARRSIFTHKIDKGTIDQSISAMQTTAWDDYKKNRGRKEGDALISLLQAAAPYFLVVICLVAVIFTYDFSTKSQEKTIAYTDANMKYCSIGYVYMNQIAPANNTTVAPTGLSALKLPIG